MSRWGDLAVSELLGGISEVLGGPAPATPPPSPAPAPAPPGVSPEPPTDPRAALSPQTKAVLTYMGIDPETGSIEEINRALTGLGIDPLPTAPPAGQQPAPAPAPTQPGPPGQVPTPGTIPPTSTDTDELSGAAAQAAKRLDEALEKNHTELNAADEQLADAILQATSTSDQGKARLQALQQSIIDEVNKLGPTLDTPAGQQQLADFLQGKTSDITQVLKTAGLDAESHGEVLDALAARYEALGGQEPGTNSHDDHSESGSPDGPQGGTPPGATAPTTDDAGLPLANDPMLNGLASDPLMAGLGSLAGPAMGALGSLPGMMGPMIPSFGGPMGGGLPLGDIGAGIASALRDPARAGGEAGVGDRADEPLKDPRSASANDPRQEPRVEPEPLKDPEEEEVRPAAGPGQAPEHGSDAGPGQTPPPAPAPDTTVTLPDGETVTAASAPIATAGRAVLDGASIEDAYGRHGMPLSPPGTPVTSPVSPANLGFGDLGQFTDHRVMALGPTKVWVNGQVTPIEQLETGPNFLGWEHPPAPAAAPTGPVAAKPPASNAR